MSLCNRLSEYNEDVFTLEDIKRYEGLLGIYIKVVCAENFNSISYSGKERETKLYLYKNGNRFDVINSMQAFIGGSNYCHKCDKPYESTSKQQHVHQQCQFVLCVVNPNTKTNTLLRSTVKNVIGTVTTDPVRITSNRCVTRCIDVKVVIRS